jgi:DNA mismatch repair protein PMS2
VSNVTGGFKERIASYALDSPDGVRSIDATLTPVPEVTIPQSSPSERVRRAPEEESEESDVDERPIRQTSRNFKRTITTIITPSQMEAIIGPSKRGRTDEDTSARRRAQTSLKDHFLRKADDSRVRGRGNDIETLELLSQEQVSTMLATIDTNEDDELTGEDDDVLMQVEQDDAPDEESSMEDEQDDSVVQEENIEMEEELNEIEDITPVTAQEKSMETPKKSEHNLFRFRQKNAVHNLRTTTANIILESIKSQHNSLKQIHHRTSRHGTIAKKDYSEPNEKAEERLSLTVSKEDFSRMRIVGQFNLGFIIAVRERQLDSDVEDVFIIDQHASDEKYNFERLQTETVMQVQNLAR